MWMMVMFDLPVTSPEKRKRYAQFRKRLLNDGFMQLQFSVYARPCASEENAAVHRKRVEKHVPVEGDVRIMMFTDKQWERQERFFGKKPAQIEQQPDLFTSF